MLSPEVAERIAEHLRLVRHPVELVVAPGDGEQSAEVTELVEDLAALSDRITVARGGHARRPSFAVTRPGTDIAVRFAGAPTGDALSSLVLAILHVGGHPPKVDPGLVERIAALDVPVEIETWFATSCRSCGDTLHAFGVISVLNPRVRHTAVNGAAFSDEAEVRGIVAVPAVFINGERLTQGRTSTERAVELLEARAG